MSLLPGLRRDTSGGAAHRLKIHAAALLAALAVGLTALRADILPTPRWKVVADGDVKTAVEKNGVVYLGGYFSHVFEPAPPGTFWVDKTTGAPLSGCATGASDVTPDAAGGGFVGASPTAVYSDASGPFVPPAGTVYLRVLPNCRWDRAFLPSTALGQPFDTGSVIVSTSPGKVSADLVALDRTTGQTLARVTQWPVVRIELLGMVDADTAVVMTVENPPTVTYSLRHLKLSTMSLVDQASLPIQPSLWFAAGRVYVQPNFDAQRNGWPPTTPKPTYALDAATLLPAAGWTTPTDVGPLVYAAGFLFTNGNTGLLRRDPVTGAVDTAWPLRAGVSAVTADGGRLIVRVPGGFGALNASSGATESWSVSAFSGTVRVANQAIALTGLLGVNGKARNGMAAVDSSTGDILPFNPFQPASVRQVVSMTANGTHLYVGLASNPLQRVHLASGTLDPTWAGNFNGGAPAFPTGPAALVATDSTLFAAGYFTFVSGTFGGAAVPQTSRAYAAAIDLAAGQVTAWNPNVARTGPGGAVRFLALANGAMYLGGTFDAVGGQSRSGFARVDLSTGAVLTPSVPASLDPTGLATDGVVAYVANPSSTLGQLLLARVDPGGAVAAVNAVNPQAAGVIYGGGRIYADRERDAVTLQPTASTLTGAFAFAGEGGVLARYVGGGGLQYHPFAVAAAPSAPQGLAAQTSGNALQLSWAAPGGNAAVADYVVRAGTGPGLSNLADVALHSLATSLATAAPNGTYYVRVHALNAYGLSPASNEVTFTLGPAPCTAPGIPGTLSSTVTGAQVAFSWGAASGATSYALEAGTASGLANIAVVNVGGALAFATPAPAGTYFVRVRGVNACGSGAATNEVTAVVGGAVAVPGSPQSLGATVTGRTVTLAWTAPTTGGAATGYILEAGTGPGLADIAAAPLPSPGFAAANVPPGRYYVRVRATNAAGSGPPTADVTVVVP
jgi:hypothetical protein